MSRAKFKIELLLTVLCLFMVYSLATKDDVPNTAIPASFKELPREPINYVELEGQDVYQVAENNYHPASLQVMAGREARRMIETGDVSKFQEELDKNGWLMNVLGY